MISAQVDLGWAGGEEAVILNVQQTGFYRVNYDLANWGLLAQHLLANHRQIHRINRAQVSRYLSIYLYSVIYNLYLPKAPGRLSEPGPGEPAALPRGAADHRVSHTGDRLRALVRIHIYYIYY